MPQRRVVSIVPSRPPVSKRRLLKPLHVLAVFALCLLIAHHLPLSIPHSHQPALLTVTHGGIGNQIYFLLQALILARQTGLVLVPPTIPARRLPRFPHRSEEHPAQNFWDLGVMARFAPLSEQLPSSCRRGITHVYLVRRGAGKLLPSSRLLQIVCQMAGDKQPSETVGQCADRAMSRISVHRHHMKFSTAGDPALVHELRQLRDACVIVDGHSFSFSGHRAHQYVYSVLHYVEAAPIVKEMMRNSWASRMTLLHLRYDEHECDTEHGGVCIRRKLNIGSNDTVVYVTPSALVGAVVRKMRSANSTSLYIAASPYVPPQTMASLENEFQAHIRVLPRVGGLDEAMENFVERELAINAHVFVGDFASTWSGTVYFKRRTMGKVSDWSCVLVDQCQDLGYYEDKERLNAPEWFEKEENLLQSE
ncbi:hypothetical protein BWQ96_06020 [Gracilariopsis chorda]|uniref:O-fucosyltransferase family protein n=1 Tax=Gracilariopsis chorda TaxID=448386 RepID=A0A2V3IQ90_9FLOR|nr:hypothetical protein BWQ96_06020 [Gracilariopsis chorda]|eukprot:PXF44239.1 hypothetical protein BWQ96_06020 [Gracilariopsis chorda]